MPFSLTHRKYYTVCTSYHVCRQACTQSTYCSIYHQSDMSSQVSLLLHQKGFGGLFLCSWESMWSISSLAASLFGSTPMREWLRRVGSFFFLLFFSVVLLCLPPMSPSCHSCQPDASKVGLPVEPFLSAPPRIAPGELLEEERDFYVHTSICSVDTA